jgi:hypothetical protein
MTSVGLLCIILGFLLMVLIIMNNLISQGILMTREQKINIFLAEYESMDKNDKIRFLNDYYDNQQFNSICQLFNSN